MLFALYAIGTYKGGKTPFTSLPADTPKLETLSLPPPEGKTERLNTDTTPKPAPATLPLVAEKKLFVRGTKVALRADPNSNGAVLDRLNNGLLVYRLDIQGDWVKVQHSITQKIGWVSIKRLGETPARQEEAKPREKELDKKKIEKTLSRAAIVALLIKASLDNYRGSCACPYNTDRAGHRCGKRSAYSKPGGASPLCFAGDVTEAMVAGFSQ